jgi:gliding motility-associated-like protein
MKKTIYLLALICPLFSFSQVVCTSQDGQTIQNIIENHFIGEGVSVSNVRFNGSLTANTNQLGIFTNANTTGNNIRLGSGIVIATGDIQDAASGAAAVHSSGSNPPSNDYNAANAIPLYNLLQSQGSTQSMNDIGVLSFDFVPQGGEVSFKYVFASDEYPGFVCSTFNDAFGFFVSGPYLADGITPAPLPPGTSRLVYSNIAIIPGSSDPEIPVTINTVNGGSAAGSVTPCILTNSNLHIQQSSGSNINKMQGYTIALETKRVDVLPCYKYRIYITICDVGDNAYNSAVYLGANSFKTDVFKLTDTLQGSVISKDSIVQSNCSSAKIKVKLNRPATSGEAYTFQVGGNMVEGQDYEPFGSQLSFPLGDSISEVTIQFRENPLNSAGQIKNLKIISEYTTTCTIQDTINIYSVTPGALTFSNVTPTSKLYCNDILPQTENLEAQAINGIGEITYRWTDEGGNLIGDTPEQRINSVNITHPTTITITAIDSCNRQISKQIPFTINSGSTIASANKELICEGDSVMLSCTNAVTCIWTSSPADMKLAQNNTSINPIAMPAYQTNYYVTITDANGCEASDTVKVTAIPAVHANMSLSPTKLTFSNTESRFIDQTANAFSRLWNFGDQTSSTQLSGTHTFPNDQEKEYEVTLIAYNEALCADTAKGMVIVKPDFTIFLPSAFTPGSVNANSIFKPLSSMDLEYELSIFNRWGEKIFYTNKKGFGWDGKLKNGSYAPDGSYVWYLIYHDGDGLLQSKTGTVALIINPR